MKVVITGGHHSSALPIIEQFKVKYPETELYWFGHKTTLKGDKNETLEYKEIKSLGIPFYNLRAGKVYKTYDPVRLIKVPLGFIQALFLLLKIRPDVILSFGGYLAVPTVIAGWLLGIPSITHEQTVVAGYANKVISFFTKKICVGWKESAKYFPQKKVVYTGVPVRKSIFEMKSHSFEVNNDLPFLYVTAGKTGSHIINEVVKEALPELLALANVIHQCGDNSKYNDYEQLEAIYRQVEDLSEGKYFLRRFIFDDEIGEAFNRASLVISRAGAHTVTELLALEKPAILIPIPWASHNEQWENASMLRKYGLAEILEEKDLNEENLLAAVKKVLAGLPSYKIKDPEALNIVNLSAGEVIADETFGLAKKDRR